MAQRGQREPGAMVKRPRQCGAGAGPVRTRAVAVRLLDAAGGRGGLARGLGGQLLARGLAAGRLASGLLGASHASFCQWGASGCWGERRAI